MGGVERLQTVKVRLYRVYLNHGGYEYGRNGRYFGHGSPLYKWVADESFEVEGMCRAKDRDEAKAQIRAKYRDTIVFYR